MAWVEGRSPDNHAWLKPQRWGGFYLQDEEVVIHYESGSEVSSWILYDYFGSEIKSSTGVVSSPVNLGVLPLGWYKLYFKGQNTGFPWFEAKGEEHFQVSRRASPLRNTPFPVNTPLGMDSHCFPGHAISGSRPYRYDLDLGSNFQNNLAELKSEITECLKWIVPEPNLPAPIFVQFPDGRATGGPNPTEEDTAQIIQAVQELSAMGVIHFESRNEPNAGPWNISELMQEWTVFYDTVKSANPNAQVIGMCTVTIGKGDVEQYIRKCLQAGAGDVMDIMSVHVYNATNGDIRAGRESYSGLRKVLESEGFTKPIWMTEWGMFAWTYGAYEPRTHVQQTMMEIHMSEQFGISRNHFSSFYPKNVGFWDYPSFWYTNDWDRQCPSALPAVYRVWVEETWGKPFAEKLNFGPEDNIWMASRFTGTGGESTIAITPGGATGELCFELAGQIIPEAVIAVDAFGNISTVMVNDGLIILDVQDQEPHYLRLPSGVRATPKVKDYGREMFISQRTVSGSATSTDEGYGNSPSLMLSGNLEYPHNGYSREPFKTGEIEDGQTAYVGVKAKEITRVDTLVFHFTTPWQVWGAPTEFDIQYLNKDSEWVTVYSRSIPTPYVLHSSSIQAGRCFIDSYWSREHIFKIRLDKPVAGTEFRLLAHKVSSGGGFNSQAGTAYGRATTVGFSGPAKLTCQEISGYLSGRNEGGTAQKGSPMVIIKR